MATHLITPDDFVKWSPTVAAAGAVSAEAATTATVAWLAPEAARLLVPAACADEATVSQTTASHCQTRIGIMNKII